MIKIYEVEYSDLIKAPHTILDTWIETLHEIINASDIYDWNVSLVDVVERLQNGHFNIIVQEDEGVYSLEICGICIDYYLHEDVVSKLINQTTIH